MWRGQVRCQRETGRQSQVLTANVRRPRPSVWIRPAALARSAKHEQPASAHRSRPASWPASRIADDAPGGGRLSECAPENWIGVGGSHGRSLAQLAERFAISCHGLSLSLGGIAPLDRTLLTSTRQFLDRFEVRHYSEHLSYCSDDGHLYDLLPIPFTDEAVRHVAARIGQAQDHLGRRIAVENISYYAAPYQAMSELAFIRAVLDEADCDLLLDINNVYVNACNHRYDPVDFLHGLPCERVTAMHVAGHYDEAPTSRSTLTARR